MPPASLLGSLVLMSRPLPAGHARRVVPDLLHKSSDSLGKSAYDPKDPCVLSFISRASGAMHGLGLGRKIMDGGNAQEQASRG